MKSPAAKYSKKSCDCCERERPSHTRLAVSILLFNTENDGIVLRYREVAIVHKCLSVIAVILVVVAVIAPALLQQP